MTGRLQPSILLRTGTDDSPPLVSVIIPHYGAPTLTAAVMSALRESTGHRVEILVVDDRVASNGSLPLELPEHSHLAVLEGRGRSGFGAACNVGLRSAKADIVMVLNDDVVVGPRWLDPLLAAALEHPECAAFQAKTLDLASPTHFDYSGAAGGMIDRLGYPFALGRVFDAIEQDAGQYDEPREIFWAVGAALLLRRNVALALGGFDEAFFMHMEEIDLCWRLQAAGHTVRSVPASVIYHRGGGTLAPTSFEKVWLNHRNNLVLLLKNLPWTALGWVLPKRLVLEGVTAVYGLVRGDWRRAVASLGAVGWLALHLPSVLRRRRRAHRLGAVNRLRAWRRADRRSIVWDHFVRRKSPSHDR